MLITQHRAQEDKVKSFYDHSNHLFLFHSTPLCCNDGVLYIRRSVYRLTLFEGQQYGGVWRVTTKVATSLGIPEELVLSVLELLSPLKPPNCVCSFRQVQETTHHECIVIQESSNGWGTKEKDKENLPVSYKHAQDKLTKKIFVPIVIVLISTSIKDITQYVHVIQYWW